MGKNRSDSIKRSHNTIQFVQRVFTLLFAFTIHTDTLLEAHIENLK